MVLVRHLHIHRPRLEQPHLIPAKQRRERNIHLRIRQIHPHARPRATTKRRQLSGPPLHAPLIIIGPVVVVVVVEPAVRVKDLRVREDGRVVMHVHVVHGDGGVGRDGPGFVRERGGGRGEAGHAADDAVGHAEALFDDGGEVGEGFEVAPERDGVGGGWEGGGEFGGEGAVDARGVEDVEGDDGEGVAGRFVAGDDEQDAFVREAVEASFLRGHFVVVCHFVKNGRDRIGLGIGLGSGLTGSSDLLLDHLFW